MNYKILLCLFGMSIFLVTGCVASESILGGHKAKQDEFPYQVSVQFPGFGHSCGGGIIGDQFILTAAHCVLRRDNQFFHMQMIILAGTVDLHKKDKPGVIVQVEKVYVPTDYIRSSPLPIGDIAVLKLKHRLELSKHIKKVELPKNQQDTYNGKSAKIAGFGWNMMRIIGITQDGYSTDTQLRSAEADILGTKQCQYENQMPDITDKHVCARINQNHHPKPRGACVGDSGGPLVLDGNTVVGVLSKCPLYCSEEIRTSVYTRVSRYLTFIHNAVTDNRTESLRMHVLPL